ncbi:hypothetical protein ACFWZY_30995 [Streptomyces sp. NPDC058992]|uniref:hypothetical protein n=1 Tax=Streptomyces sp. NPDC058992 TaxID=3346688 RepID=UPI0036C76BFC
MTRTFDHLVAEAESVSVAGWDFSWLDGRATEQRPSWGYQRLRKVVWTVPGFTVAHHRDRLRELHERTETEGPFVARTTRFLIEARKPG